jgi:hypothetical protein
MQIKNECCDSKEANKVIIFDEVYNLSISLHLHTAD